MFEKLIRFFLENSKFNYTLFFLILFMGIFSYINLPKEKFPNVELDMILVSGGYAGASNDLLDKMAVSEIEDELQSVEGVNKVTSTISNNSFSIVLELEEGRDKYNISEKVKDAISKAEQNFPSDMNTPTVRVIDRSSTVIRVGLVSEQLKFSKLIDISDSIKSKLLSIDGVSDVSISGDSNKFINVRVDSKLIEFYGLNPQRVFEAISNLSYIYPLGKIEDRNYHFYLTTYNGKKSPKAIENTIIYIDGKKIYLKDIAKVEKRYEDDKRIATLNTHRSIDFTVNKYEEANALIVAKEVKRFVDNFNLEDREYRLEYYLDNSRSIKNRLNNVISNIFLGLILVFLSIYFLVNKKMAFVVSIGVPTSFFIAFLIFYSFGLSLNLVSLLALLIALGILVDDAIIVAENIQRHIDDGTSTKEACVLGAKEVITPVTMATLTTIFTFLPLLFISGTMGILIQMIPIGVTFLVIASYIESFFFLPIHSKHMLKRGDKSRDWSFVKNIYRKILNIHIKYKKSFVFIFLIVVPVLTLLSIKNSKFQMFPKVDIPTLYISGKLNINSDIEQTNELVKELSREINSFEDRFSINNISTIAGYRRTAVGESESGENLFYIYIELNELTPQNIVDKYITPYLSLDYDENAMVREIKNREIIQELKEVLKRFKESNSQIEELTIFERRIGAVKVDVEVGVLTDTTEKLRFAIDKIEKKISELNGVTSISNNAISGIDEIKLKINSYGESLGFNERYLAQTLSNLFQSNRKSLSFDEKELLDVVIEDINKDKIETLKELTLKSPTGKAVALTEIVSFEIKSSLNSINKQDFKRMKSVYANVDTKIITATEVLEYIEPTLNNLKEEGVEFKFFGEAEKKRELLRDLIYATVVALFLIFLALLYMFNSFRYTFMVISIIPFSILGVLVGHFIMGMNLTMPGLIGIFGLAGVVINDSIVMLDFLRRATNKEEVIEYALKRFRPVILTSITTLFGLSTMIFFVSGQGKILQPIAISLGFGLAWGTVLNLIYLPTLFSIFLKRKRVE